MIDEITLMNFRQFLNELVNDEIFNKNFHHKKPVLDGAYCLIATAGWPGKNGRSQEFKICARCTSNKEVAWACFKSHDGQNLSADSIDVLPAHRRRGLASEIYKFAQELGNTIVPSTLQTADGKKFWNSRKT